MVNSGVVTEQMSVVLSLEYGRAEWEMDHQVGRYLADQLFRPWTLAMGAALLGWEDITLRPYPMCEVLVQGRFYLFKPRPGQQLVGRVHHKAADHLEILVLGMFHARIDCNVEMALPNVKIGQPLRFKVLAVTLNTGHVRLAGDPVNGSLEVEDAPVEIFELADCSLKKSGDGGNNKVSFSSEIETIKIDRQKTKKKRDGKDAKLIEEPDENANMATVINKDLVDKSEKVPEKKKERESKDDELLQGCGIDYQDGGKKVYISPIGKKFKSRKRLFGSLGAVKGSDIKETDSKSLKMELVTSSQPIAKHPTTTDEAAQATAEESEVASNLFRRSGRRSTAELEREKEKSMEARLLVTDDSGLGIRIAQYGSKGRGIMALKPFRRGEFVVEYAGDLVDKGTAVQRENSLDPSQGFFMYYFEHKGKQYCIDATQESGRYGRLMNHSRRNPNCMPKVVTLDPDTPRLILVAKQDIQPGTELVYDYGDRSPVSLSANPWLAL